MNEMPWTLYQLYRCLLKGGKVEKSYRVKEAVEVIVRMPTPDGTPNSYVLHFRLEPASALSTSPTTYRYAYIRKIG